MAENPNSKKPVGKVVKPIAPKPVAARPAVKLPPQASPPPVAVKAPVPAPVPIAIAKTVVPKPEPSAPAKSATPIKKAVTPPFAAVPVTPPKPDPVIAPAPVAVAPVVTPPVPKTSAVKPPVASPVVVSKTEDAAPAAAPAAALPVEKISVAIPAAAFAEGKSIMNDTIAKAQETLTNATKETTERASALFNDMNGRTKVAVEKGTKAIEELVEFSKGNLEAVVASGRVAAKGAEEIAKYSADYGRQSIEKANVTAKQFAAVKTPAEFLQLQGDVAKTALDSLVSEGAKFTESYLKLLGEIAQPISNRYAVAAEKVKSAVTV